MRPLVIPARSLKLLGDTKDRTRQEGMVKQGTGPRTHYLTLTILDQAYTCSSDPGVRL